MKGQESARLRSAALPAEYPDAERSVLLSHSSTAVMTQGQPHAMSVELRDAFNNPCEPDDWEQLRPRLAVSVVEVRRGSGTGWDGDTGTGWDGDSGTGWDGDRGTGWDGDRGTGWDGDRGTGWDGDSGTG